MPMSHRKMSRSRLVVAGVAAVLVVGMGASTNFYSPDELAEALPKPFDPGESATELFEKATTEMAAQAQPLGDVVAGVTTDPEAAAEALGAVSPNESSWVFPVTAVGTVEEATGESLRLKVDGVPAGTTVIVPLGNAIQGTVIRDVAGFKFADAPGQTAYQYVGDELKKLMQASLQEIVADPGSLKGKQVTVVGAISVLNNGAPQAKAKPVNVQPVAIEVN